MAYSEELAYRIAQSLILFKEEFTHKKMFGGMAYLYKGKMTVGIIEDELCVRVIDEKCKLLLQNDVHTRAMNFTGKVMKEFLFVNEEGSKTEEQLMKWIALGLEHAKTKLKEV